MCAAKPVCVMIARPSKESVVPVTTSDPSPGGAGCSLLQTQGADSLVLPSWCATVSEVSLADAQDKHGPSVKEQPLCDNLSGVSHGLQLLGILQSSLAVSDRIQYFFLLPL